MLDKSAELQGVLEDALARHRVAGASVAVLQDGRLMRAAGGIANLTTGVKITPETVMHIGSITKVLNATLVMQLVDEHAIALDEPVIRYLPELRLREAAALERISVRMLLDHTSGIDGAWLPDHGHDEETIDKAIVRYAQLGQLFAPGAECSYCNVAPVIAGYLVQRIRGRSWYQVVRERIFEPLQLTHAAATPEEALLHNASVGHFLDSASDQLVRTPFAFGPLSFGPAGSTLMLSARDLVTFAAAHMAEGVGSNGNRILSAQSTEAMQQISFPARGRGSWDLDLGVGWMLLKDGLLHHAGGGPGVYSELFVHPKKRFVAAILTNTAHGFELSGELMDRWLRPLGASVRGGMEARARDSSANDISANDIDCSRYVGIYEDVLTRYRISRETNGLSVSRQKKFVDCENVSTEPTPPQLLIPTGGDRFVVDQAGPRGSLWAANFRFCDPDGAGRMRQLWSGSLHVRESGKPEVDARPS